MSHPSLQPLQMTPVRERVLAFIKAEVAADRPFPSESAINAHMGWKSATAARDPIHALWNMGHLRLVSRDRRYRGRTVWALVEEGAAA